MMKLRFNKYLVNLLETSRKMWNEDVEPLNLAQLEWRTENQTKVLGLKSSYGFLFKKYTELIIAKRKDGNYVLFAPASKKDDGIPSFFYDILDIAEFVKRYPVQPVYEGLDDLYDEVETIKEKMTRGFVETRENTPTQIFEIA